jgi:ubiquinone/menaquinone biosynthesis C-methylase UbiE
MRAATFEETRPSDYLTRLAASDLGKAYKSLAAAELAIRPGDMVVDLGCGPRADLPAFAAAAGGSGRVIGIDRDLEAVRQARDVATTLARVEVHQADIQALGLPTGSVDRVHTDRVLQHVPEPATALAEARRVLRRGGTAVFAEPDWDTLIIDYPDVATARAYTRYITDHVVRNATLGRELPRLAEKAGLSVGQIIPITAVFRDAEAADRILGLRRVTSRAVAAQYLSADSASEWLAYLASQSFFASMTLFIVTAAAA